MSHGLMRATLLPLLMLVPLPTEAQVEKLTEADLDDYQQRLPDAIAAAKGVALKNHLNALLGQKTPEGRLAVANVVRVAADLSRQPAAVGQLVHYAVPAMSEMQPLPRQRLGWLDAEKRWTATDGSMYIV